MQKRFIQRQQAKCNFCMNWFVIYSQIKFGLNICQTCIYKALHTSCFKLPTPQGNLYQVYLAQRHLSIQSQKEDIHMEKVDEFMHNQIKSLLGKWEKISEYIKKKKNKKQDEFDKDGTWKQIQFILKNDRKKFDNQVIQTIQQITEDMENTQNTIEKTSKQSENVLRTPLKQKKSANISIKCIDTSAAKGLKRECSKKSLGIKSTSRKSINLAENCPNSPAPFNLQSNSRITSRSRITLNNQMDNALESNREFQAKIQATKSNIATHLQKKFGIKSAHILPLKKQKIFETIQNTTNINKCIELVSYKIPDEEFDMQCYLASLEWQGIQVVKFVRVGLSDDKIRNILECIADKNVQTLVLTNNSLTQETIKQMVKWDIPSLKNIYLGKNNILPLKVRDQIGQLRKKYRIFV